MTDPNWNQGREDDSERPSEIEAVLQVLIGFVAVLCIAGLLKAMLP